MREFKIYLAGACRGLPDEGKIWRKETKEYFDRYNNVFSNDGYRIITYDPTSYFKRDGSNSVSSKQIKNFYLKHLINNSDLVLVNLNDTQYSVGTGCELQYAECHEIPVVGFGVRDIYEWFSDYCDVVFDNQKEALEHIVGFYL